MSSVRGKKARIERLRQQGILPKTGWGASRVRVSYMEPDTEAIVVVALNRRSRQGSKLFGFRCPECDFIFERTSPGMAEAWARQHNTDTHQNAYPVRVRIPILSQTPPS